MSWKKVTVMEERKRFMQLLGEEDCPGVSALCREFGISRKTAYKWIDRYRVSGCEGLADQSRAAHSHPNAIGLEIEQRIIQARHKFPRWGAKKLLGWLHKHGPKCSWPCPASVSAIWERNQMVRSRKRRRPVEPYQGALSMPRQPNDTWSIDHKGWWLAGNGDKCEPFTVSDLASRYVIRCVLGRSKGIEHVRPVLRNAFEEFGLPLTIRSDNGAPFASRAPLGLSQLSVWLLRLGIVHERIEAGKPQQNGCHERMHRTMLEEQTAAVGNTLRQEQTRLNHWRDVFNNERPHEALGLDTPACHYVASARAMPRRLPALEYPARMQVRKVDTGGQFGWKGKHPFLTEALGGQHVGFDPTDQDATWTLWLGNMHLGSFDEKRLTVTWAKAATRHKHHD